MTKKNSTLTISSVRRSAAKSQWNRPESTGTRTRWADCSTCSLWWCNQDTRATARKASPSEACCWLHSQICSLADVIHATLRYKLESLLALTSGEKRKSEEISFYHFVVFHCQCQQQDANKFWRKIRSASSIAIKMFDTAPIMRAYKIVIWHTSHPMSLNVWRSWSSHWWQYRTECLRSTSSSRAASSGELLCRRPWQRLVGR